MSRIHPRPLTILVLLAAMALGLAAPAAADVSCTGSMGATTVDDTLVVPDGATCSLTGTTINGNVLIGRQATLTASDISVDDNVQDDTNDAGTVTITGSRIGGSVQLEQGAGATITGNAIDSDLQLESNSAALRAENNAIGGNLQANQNRGGLRISGNTIDGNLQCQSNTPAPTGSGNVVRGSAEDQCASLTGGDSGAAPAPQPTQPAPPATSRSTDRLAGADRFATSVAIARAAFPQGAAVVYLARADQFADALAGSSLSDGPILLVPGCGELPTSIRDGIRQLDPQRVVAPGGTGAICDAMLTVAGNA